MISTFTFILILLLFQSPPLLGGVTVAKALHRSPIFIIMSSIVISLLFSALPEDV